MVVLTVKNLQHQSFSIEIDISSTVKELKEKIEKEKGSDYPANGQKLIYAGKILQDASTLDTYKIDDSKFLVVLVTKPKSSTPPPAVAETEESSNAQAASETSNETASAAAAATAAPQASVSTPTDTTSSTATTATTQSTTTTTTESRGSNETAESLVVMGDDFNRMVENIMEMGYERPQVERALRASFNNPYTAVTYLVDGIPPGLAEVSADAGAVNPSSIPTGQPQSGGDDEQEAEGDDPLAFLRNQPQFAQMRELIRLNPTLLDAFIQQIGQTNPELLEVIHDNQELFVRMLNEGSPSRGSGTTASSGTTPSSGGGGGGGGPTAARPATGEIVISTSDRDAINRLKALGNFPEDVVIQAYFACEKNENLAAEFLFSQVWD